MRVLRNQKWLGFNGLYLVQHRVPFPGGPASLPRINMGLFQHQPAIVAPQRRVLEPDGPRLQRSNEQQQRAPKAPFAKLPEVDYMTPKTRAPP